MSTAVWIAVAIAAAVPLSYAVAFNRLARARNRVRSAWADVEAELARRHEVVPALVAVVATAAAHERAVLERAATTEARARAAFHTPEGASAVEPPLAAAVARVVALRERYPQLDAQQNFLELHDELALTEDRIAAARRYYNFTVAELNRRCAAFPSNVVARRHGFVPATFLDL